MFIARLPKLTIPELLTVGDGLAIAGTRSHCSARANAQNERKAIIERRQDPASCGEVCAIDGAALPDDRAAVAAGVGSARERAD